jgi:hypothetical protein
MIIVGLSSTRAETTGLTKHVPYVHCKHDTFNLMRTFCQTPYIPFECTVFVRKHDTSFTMSMFWLPCRRAYAQLTHRPHSTAVTQ